MKDGWQLELLKAMLVLLTAPEFRNILKVLMKDAVDVLLMLLETLSWLDKELLQLLHQSCGTKMSRRTKEQTSALGPRRTGSSKISTDAPHRAPEAMTLCLKGPSTHAPGRRP